MGALPRLDQALVGLANILQENRAQGFLVLRRREGMMMGLTGPWGWQRWDVLPMPARQRSSSGPLLGSSRSQAGAGGAAGTAHLLTLVVTDGKFIQNKVPALPALPLEKRRGNSSVLGSSAVPTLSWSCIQSIPGASPTHGAARSPRPRTRLHHPAACGAGDPRYSPRSPASRSSRS